MSLIEWYALVDVLDPKRETDPGSLSPDSAHWDRELYEKLYYQKFFSQQEGLPGGSGERYASMYEYYQSFSDGLRDQVVRAMSNNTYTLKTIPDYCSDGWVGLLFREYVVKSFTRSDPCGPLKGHNFIIQDQCYSIKDIKILLGQKRIVSYNSVIVTPHDFIETYYSPSSIEIEVIDLSLYTYEISGIPVESEEGILSFLGPGRIYRGARSLLYEDTIEEIEVQYADGHYFVLAEDYVPGAMFIDDVAAVIYLGSDQVYKGRLIDAPPTSFTRIELIDSIPCISLDGEYIRYTRSERSDMFYEAAERLVTPDWVFTYWQASYYFADKSLYVHINTFTGVVSMYSGPDIGHDEMCKLAKKYIYTGNDTYDAINFFFSNIGALMGVDYEPLEYDDENEYGSSTMVYTEIRDRIESVFPFLFSGVTFEDYEQTLTDDEYYDHLEVLDYTARWMYLKIRNVSCLDELKPTNTPSYPPLQQGSAYTTFLPDRRHIIEEDDFSGVATLTSKQRLSMSVGDTFYLVVNQREKIVRLCVVVTKKRSFITYVEKKSVPYALYYADYLLLQPDYNPNFFRQSKSRKLQDPNKES